MRNMSVEIVGAQGFEYQYVVTLYMILKNLEMDNFKIWIENESFEDAKLSYMLDGTIYNIELQVKKKSSEITYDEFATWLAHFQKNRSDYFILDKIHESETNYLIFVTDNRCTDFVSKFLGTEYGIRENKANFTKRELNDLKLRMLNGFDSVKELGRNRKEHIEQFFEGSRSELNNVFSRVCVIERKDQIEKEICDMLKNQYQISEIKCEDIMKQMIKIVQYGRDSGKEIAAKIGEIINNNRVNRILPEDKKFYKRNNIDELEEMLEQKNILLLTGIPFSGKTYIAKTIAQNLQDNGYYVKLTDSILGNQEAKHFLVAPDNDLRLLLIEDPFGHNLCNEKSIAILDEIQYLIRNGLSNNRKIIITSRKDILLEAFRKKQIEECNIQENAWINTSINSIEEAKKIWLCFYGKSDASLQVFERLNTNLVSPKQTEFLEIGEIRHLSLNVNIDELVGMSTDKIINKARISSEDVCRKIKSYGEEYKKIFILLGCFCDTVKKVNIKDLEYILCSDEEAVSIRQNMENIIVCIGGKFEKSYKNQEFPQYVQEPKLDDNIKCILREFCEKGYIYKERGTNELYFLHPIYTYASKLLLREEIIEDWDIDNYIEYIRRAIESLSPNAALCSLRQLSEEFGTEQIVIDCIVEGSKSIFPAIRDAAILYLDRNFDNLNEQTQMDLMKNIKYGCIPDDYVLWKGNECWYQKDAHYYVEYFDMDILCPQKIDMALEEIEQRLQNRETFSKKEIYDILCSELANSLSYEFLDYALLSDEAFIRSKAIFHLFQNYASEFDFEKTDYLQDFENHNVVREMLKGMLNSIESFCDRNIEELILYFQKQFERKSVAMYVEDLFDLFGDEDKSKAVEWRKYNAKDRVKIWKIWAVLFPKWLECFPVKFDVMNEPRMSWNLDQSLKYLSNQQEVVDIANAWIRWIQNYSKYHCVNEYGLSVLEYLIKGTEASPSLRKDMIKKELKANSTSVVTSHISHIVDLWENLTDQEQADVSQYLKNEIRSDMKWIKAVALTRKEVPEDIQIATTGNVFMDKDPKVIIDVLNKKNILNECLHVFCGYPQLLWFYGYHHNENYVLWDRVMVEVLKRHINDEAYNISLREWIDALYNSTSRRFINEYNLYKEMLSNEEKRKQIFTHLLYVTATQCQDNKKMWDDLLKECAEQEKKQYFKQISKFIEMVEFVNMGHNELLCEYNFEDIINYILPCLPQDESIFKFSETMIWQYEEVQNIESNPYVIIGDELKKIKLLYEQYIEEFYKTNPPRLLFTDRIVITTCGKLGGLSETIQKVLEKHRQDFFDRYEEVREKFEKEYSLKIMEEHGLKNWNS